MGQDKSAHGFQRRKRQVALRYLKLVTLSVLGVVTIAANSFVRKAIAFSTVLANWRFDPAESQLEITLNDGTTPRYFLLAQPPRIVIDLPNTQLGRAETQQTYSGAVRQVRVSQFQEDVTRIVLELSPDVVLLPQQVELQQLNSSEGENRWLVRPLIAQTPTPVAQFSEPLPPAILPTNPDGVVNVPPVTSPEASIPVTPPAALPPTGVPTNQLPTVNVPSLQVPPPQTPAATPTAPPDDSPEPETHPPSSSPVVEFGQPLPTAPANTVPTPQSALPTPAPSVANAAETATTATNSDILLPAGTWFALRYPGEQPLSLKSYKLRQGVLLLEEDLRDRNDNIIAPAGTSIIGQFETNGSTSRFIAKAIALGDTHFLLEAQSPILNDNQWFRKSGVFRNSTFGALAGIVLGGFSSLSLWGSAAASEATTAPDIALPATIQPGQVLQVQLQSDLHASSMNQIGVRSQESGVRRD